eukprot:902070-Rhodomonas_salina.5
MDAEMKCGRGFGWLTGVGAQGQADAKQFNRFIVGFLQFLWPFLVLIINFFIMPALVNYSAKFMGQRYVSSMQRTTFNLIFFFMVVRAAVHTRRRISTLHAASPQETLATVLLCTRRCSTSTQQHNTTQHKT